MFLRFRIRTILAFIAICCVVLGTYAHYKRCAALQFAAVSELRAKGCAIYNQFDGAGGASQFQFVSITVNGAPMAPLAPTINPPPVRKKRYWYERWFGEELFHKYTVAVTPHDPKFELSNIFGELRSLPYLDELVVYNDNFLVVEVEQLKKEFPQLTITVFEKSIPSAMERELTLNELARRIQK